MLWPSIARISPTTFADHDPKFPKTASACWYWKMAGPVITGLAGSPEPKNVKPDSPIIQPRNASIAILPCFSSDSLYFMKFFLSLGHRSSGSKNPKGAEIPGNDITSSSLLSSATGDRKDGGMSTESIEWMTPLSQVISATSTFELSIFK